MKIEFGTLKRNFFKKIFIYDVENYFFALGRHSVRPILGSQGSNFR
jgi:hypothetical protein